MTTMEAARAGESLHEFDQIARTEELTAELVRTEIATGTLVLVPSPNGVSVALGNRARSKVLCNLGTSIQSPDISIEIEKAKEAVNRGASIICDQSVGPNIALNRRRLMEEIGVPLAAVPLYQNAELARRNKNNPLDFSESEVMTVFQTALEEGVTAPGIHVLTADLKDQVRASKRLMPFVSRGASIMAVWMDRSGEENPYIRHFDELLDLCAVKNVPLTMICSCRAGCIEDGFDALQEAEASVIGSLRERAHKNGIAVIVDGLGHMTMDQIPKAVDYFKSNTGQIPLGVMGPATTDRGLGHEHVVNAIGTAVAVQHGANYCNACSRTEHLGLPEPSDIPDTIGAAVIATYAGDLARGKHRSCDLKMARARAQNAWGLQLEMALDRKGAQETFKRVGGANKHGEGCSICGDLCPFTIGKYV